MSRKVADGLYILRGRLAVPAGTIATWGRWMAENDRRVAREEIGGYVVSTVFLGVDHSLTEGSELPILFETMIFDPAGESIDMERCGTWVEAIDMHEKCVAQVMARIEGLFHE